MNKLYIFIFCLIIAIAACKKNTTNPGTHNIILNCLGTQIDTIVYNFGDGDVKYVGKLVSSWTIVRDIKSGKQLTLKETTSAPKKNAVTVSISDNGSQVAFAKNDTSAAVMYTVP